MHHHPKPLNWMYKNPVDRRVGAVDTNMMTALAMAASFGWKKSDLYLEGEEIMLPHLIA